MTPLSNWFFVLGPVRVGRIAVSVTKRFAWPQRYRASAGMWTAWEFCFIRIYLYAKPEASR